MNIKGKEKFFIITIIGIFLIALFLSYNKKEISDVSNKILSDPNLWPDYDLGEVRLNQEDNFIQPEISWEPYKVEEKVKGIYMTGHSLGYKERFEKTVELTNQSIINAWVVDVKDDYGTITYKSSIPMVKEVGADDIVKVRDFHLIMEVLRENDIYPIARIVSFKDKQAAIARPDLAIKTNTGAVWRDRKGDAWLNPYNRETWDYLVDIAKEAAEKGFKDIQFDYVRFPTDGNRAMIDYGEAGDKETKADAIAAFIEYAREELKNHGVYVSADIFGLVTTVSDDMGLGQHLETIAPAADILLPMVYPSHYALGTYGIPIPDKDPYKIVYTSMNTARERVEALETDKPKAILRPWLQDFTASYLGAGYYKRYGSEEVRAQIKATYDAGLEEWVLWNAGNSYTWEALIKN
ncbi:hypothetical protein SAMN05446037_10093 [Anaerovirgula multivorans]|uniref:DUF4015 domain-containing protein n=1 Tax=Anaerovirgula multivorans TaxID=312168 RepID=A0A239E2H4_9FIRM|nr:putative glycoside hydrolase [Anaerovirgula multivorans]SNS38173.1 hypothetical protein SAMN05446037_10093 [Anaerovirgula multivorans]